MDVQLRPWVESDDLAGLVDADPDLLWVSQGHALHGADRDGPRWRRTTVAVDDEVVVGAVTVAANRFHPGRWSCSVEVAPSHRRQGLGSALVNEGRRLRPDLRPLAGKARPADPAAMGLVHSAGGDVYQHCDGIVVDPQDPALIAWALAARESAGEAIASLGGVSKEVLASALAEQYEWVHADWSPLGNDAPLAELGAALAADVRNDLSAGAWADGRLVATAVTFPGASGIVVMAETVRKHVEGGTELLAGALGMALQACADSGVGEVEFDGHQSDPHLPLLLRQLPWAATRPLELVEVP